MKDIDCPYCGKQQDINHDDGYGYEEDRVFEQTCSGCDKTFSFVTSIIYHYEAFKAPCLNGEGDHEFSYYIAYPREFSSKVYVHCEHTERITESEIEEYLKSKP